VALANLRKNLGPYFVIDRETVSFNPKSNVWFDVTWLETLLASVRDHEDRAAFSRKEFEHLIEAVNLYQGEFLEGFFVRDASQFEAWVTVEREHLHRLVVDAFAKLVSLHIDQGQYAEGVEQAARWLQLDPMMEKAHRQMMRLLAFSGRPGEALRQYSECVRVLDDELGLAPSQKTVALYEAIQQQRLVPLDRQQEILTSAAQEASPAPGEPPFKGLHYYDVGDAHLFFGREQLTARLVDKLHKQKFLAIIGASGSGKSSLVRAGLIPALKNREPLANDTLPPEGSEEWPIHLITPTEHPLESLALSLSTNTESVSAISALLDDMVRDERSLHLHIRRHFSGNEHRRLLLVVDQFEELFTLCHDEVERKAFIDNIFVPITDEAAESAIVVITLRADFYAHCAEYENLRTALEANQIYIGQMNSEELRRAIIGPAEAGDWEFEPGLVDLLLYDVGAQKDHQPEPGALPLLSHALLTTWQGRRGRRLTFASYAETGGVRQAIARTAETLINEELTPDQREIARQIFLRLTELGEGTADTRRRASLEELVSSQDDGVKVENVLHTLAEARLITIGEGTVEIAHEALIREWPQLRNWLDESREDVRMQRLLAKATAEWLEGNRDPSFFLHGVRLQQYESWNEETGLSLATEEREFLRASQEARAREKRAIRLRRFSMIAAFAIGLVIALLGLTGQFNRFIYRPLPVDWVEIPAGEFLMGSSTDDPDVKKDELPAHTVYLNFYEIGRYEITNGKYARCIQAGVCAAPQNRRWEEAEFEERPVTDVRWRDALKFCTWIGGRLPTEAEWEKAARGTTGNTYPWGSAAPDCTFANYWGPRHGCVGDTTAVGTYSESASPYGLMDMAGNVSEWVADGYEFYYYEHSPYENPLGSDDTGVRVERGGSWEDLAEDIQSVNRSWDLPDDSDELTGFRCAR
jgi:formylglycine-generating enzyme required for sulfatase activity/DNA-binding SARP family transcriptional activator/energy-coupling factor transporter ATP-binding protein EcfA2